MKYFHVCVQLANFWWEFVYNDMRYPAYNREPQTGIENAIRIYSGAAPFIMDELFFITQKAKRNV